jgi:5'-nucleotidase
MPYPIERKLVIAVASSALFDLSDSHKIYTEQGVDAYRKYQEENINNCFPKGVAFPFVRRLLNLNNMFHKEEPVEVVLLSRNSPETGLRAFRSIKNYGLNITRAAFFSGESPYEYLPAFNVSLFLSAEEKDVNNAIKAGYAAGRVLNNTVIDDEEDIELRLAFDFDGVIADDEAEIIFQDTHDINLYHKHEEEHANDPLRDGLLADLLKKISFFQKLEQKKQRQNPNYKRILKTSIVTARNAPSHERMIYTLKNMGVEVNEAFFLGGIDKSRILNIMKPHMFFDDQIGHLTHIDKVPAVHIPFGVANKKKL